MVPCPLGGRVEGKTKTDSEAAEQEAGKALLAMLRGICQDEPITEAIGEQVAEALLDAARVALVAYASCRMHAGNGIALAYEETVHIDGSGIGEAALRHK